MRHFPHLGPHRGAGSSGGGSYMITPVPGRATAWPKQQGHQPRLHPGVDSPLLAFSQEAGSPLTSPSCNALLAAANPSLYPQNSTSATCPLCFCSLCTKDPPTSYPTLQQSPIQPANKPASQRPANTCVRQHLSILATHRPSLAPAPMIPPPGIIHLG